MRAIVAVGQETKKFGLYKSNLVLADFNNVAAYLVGLFQNNAVPTYLSTLADLVDATFSGYVPLTPSLVGSYQDGAGRIFFDAGLALFAHNGGPISNTIYGAYLANPVAGGTSATATATQSGGAINSVTITNGGSGYEAPPAISVIGGNPGTGAILTAHLTNGVVTSVTIDAAGSGYTTPVTLSVAGPVELWMAQKFDTPVSMASAIDGIPLVFTVADQGPQGP